MAVLKGKIRSAREHAGMVWLHISSRHGIGWVSLSKHLFERAYKKRLMKQIYGKHNRVVERKITKLEREIKLLKKDEEKEYAIKDREHRIHSLRSKIKKELHMHDLAGKRIYLRIF